MYEKLHKPRLRVDLDTGPPAQPAGSPSRASRSRAEARFLSVAGLQVLALAFPFTLFLVALALAGRAPALAPLVFGAPLLLLGYAPCHLGARRLAESRRLEGRA